MTLPVLDPVEVGKIKPHDYSLRVMEAPCPAEIEVSPATWKHPNENEVADADQDFRGTCTGQATRIWSDFNYIELTGDLPTAEERSHYKKDVIDPIGTRHDVLFDNSFSAECAYQWGRFVGNITYPSGGEIRFNARALRDMGICLESGWHTDKAGTMVWTYPPGARGHAAGGSTPEEVEQFAALHRIKGWAMIGAQDGSATWDEIRAAINKYKKILCGIPIYANFSLMEGGDGTYPTPKGEIVGYHAQCCYGQSPDFINLKHSWGKWCGVNGKLTKEYFDIARDQCVWMVILDDAETKILHEIYRSLTVTAKDSITKLPIPADLYVDGKLIGKSPQTFAVIPGQEYNIEARLSGYFPATGKAVGNDGEEIFVYLNPVPTVQKTWWQLLIDWILSLFSVKS